jgi:hypothetical protein
VSTRKKTSKTTAGWIGYTLAWSWRNFQLAEVFNGINNGADFHWLRPPPIT